MSRCAWCGGENDPAQTSCVSCGTRLPGLERSQESASPAAPPVVPAMPAPAQPAPATQSAGWGAPAATSQGWGSTTYQQPGVQTWPPATVLPGSATPTAPKRSTPSMLVVVVVAGVLASLGAFLFLKVQHHISFPDTIGSYQRDDSELAKAAAKQVEDAVKGTGLKPNVAVYGSMPTPSFIVVAFEVSGTAPSGAFEEFARGVESSSGMTVQLDKTVTNTRGGATYTCAPVYSNTVPDLAVCMWDDNGTGGFLVSTVSVDAQSAVGLTAQIHDAVIG